jgi:hypothetical protein
VVSTDVLFHIEFKVMFLKLIKHLSYKLCMCSYESKLKTMMLTIDIIFGKTKAHQHPIDNSLNLYEKW